MKRSLQKTGLLFLIWAIFFAGQSIDPGPAAANPGLVLPEIHARRPSALSQEEQTRLANEDFFKIYLLPPSSTPAILEKKINLYSRIINTYPDAPLAQESYWHLIEMLLRDFRAVGKAEALTLYTRFLQGYPDSPFKTPILDTLMKFLHRTGEWQELLRLTAPLAREIDTSRKISTPVVLFMFSEATFHLAAPKEAAAGYLAILDQFPDSLMARIAETRMKEINNTAE